LVWLHGLYRTAVIRGYGGGERSFYIRSLLSELTGLEVLDVFYKRPFSRAPEGPGGLELPFSWPTILKRASLKALKPVLDPRSVLEVKFLSPSKKAVSSLSSSVEEDDVVVLDGLKGFTMIKPTSAELRKRAGSIIYLSHNFEADYFRGPKGWVLKAEGEAIRISDLVIAASVRDAVRYKMALRVNEEKLTVFPNVYPVEFELSNKAEELTMAVLAGSSPGAVRPLVLEILERGVVEALIYVGSGLPTDLLADLRDKVIYERFVEERPALLSLISRAHVGLNYGDWLGGSSVKKFDYALAGLAILSLGTGHRGEYLPGEIARVDLYDLMAKLDQFDVDALVKLGHANRLKALEYHRKAVEELRAKLRALGL